MKILLINPCLRRDNPRKFFPLGLAYIATVIDNAGYDLTIYDLDANRRTDDEFRAYLSRNRFDVVGLGTLVTHYKWIKWAISVIRETNPRARIIVGNSVATSIPEIILGKTEADVAVMGEGEDTILELLDRIKNADSLEALQGICYRENGDIVSNQRRSSIKNLDTLPDVNRDLFDIEAYLEASQHNINEPFPRPLDQVRVLNISTARGCVFSCTFCYTNFLGTRYRWRSPGSIVREIKELQNKYGINYLQFWNDLTFCNKRQVEGFCDKMLEEGMYIDWIATVLPTLFQKPGPRNDIIARKMKDTGCVYVGFSLESADEGILKAMNKPMTLEGFSNTRRTLLNAKVGALTSLVIGYPQETEETIRKTIDFCIKERMNPSVGYIQPMPCTPIYDYAISKGIIKDEEEYLLQMGDRQDFHVNLTSIPDEKLRQLVEDEVRRCQKAVLGEGAVFEDPLKTFRKRSRDEVVSRDDGNKK